LRAALGLKLGGQLQETKTSLMLAAIGRLATASIPSQILTDFTI